MPGLHIRIILPSPICEGHKITFACFPLQIMAFLLNLTNIYLRTWQQSIFDGRGGDLLLMNSRATMLYLYQISLVLLCYSITYLHPKARQNFLQEIYHQIHDWSVPVKGLLIHRLSEGEENTNYLQRTIELNIKIRQLQILQGEQSQSVSNSLFFSFSKISPSPI